MVQREPVPVKNPPFLCSQQALLWPFGHTGRHFACHDQLPISSSKWQGKGGSMERTHGFVQGDCIVGGIKSCYVINTG